MSSPPRDDSSVPGVTEEEKQLLTKSSPDIVTAEQKISEQALVQSKEEEAELSDHSDSWEVISRASPLVTEKEEGEEKEHQIAALDNLTDKEEDSPATETAAAAVGDKEEEEEEEEEEGAFEYTSIPEEIHSDADTYRTDDLFQKGEVEYLLEHGSPSLSSPATGAAAAGGGAAAGHVSGTSPQSSPSCTPTEDEDFLKLAAAIMHEHQTSLQEDQFDNAEEIIFGKYVVAPVTAAAAALVGAAHALTNATGHCVVTFADRLRFFAAKFRAYVTNLQPAVHRLAGNMAMTVHQMAKTLHLKAGPAISIPLNGAGFLARDVVHAVRHVACTAATRARKGADEISFKDVDWVKVGLAVGCAGLLGLLWKVNAANARLTGRLAQREGELAELVARIVALQRNITSRRVPIIRHTTSSTLSTTVGWPLIVQAI